MYLCEQVTLKEFELHIGQAAFEYGLLDTLSIRLADFRNTPEAKVSIGRGCGYVICNEEFHGRYLARNGG
jgi:hypothetical protein